MWFGSRILFFFEFILLLLLFLAFHCQTSAQHFHFDVKEVPYERLCSTKKILTVNGQFPGPTLRVQKGDTIYIDVRNNGKYNITLHWHGVEQLRNPWSDGPEYITQCPIQPGANFIYKVKFSSEEGTLWWHAHSDWSRATVHGAIIVYPKRGTTYPFHTPDAQVPIILGEWWKKDVMEVLDGFLKTGGDPNVSDALTINGHPGDLYPCSHSETFKMSVDQGKTYLLRIVNAAMNTILFFSISNHQLTVVGTDGSYTKPLSTNIITISPGQTIDALLHANQLPSKYYMAARAYSSAPNVPFDNTTTTAILHYINGQQDYGGSSFPSVPFFPNYNDTNAAFTFISSLRSLADKNHPAKVPLKITTPLLSTVSINTFPCYADDNGTSCQGPNGTRLAASMNNISFVNPYIDILEAYYDHINGVFGNRFPRFPPAVFNFTGEFLPMILEVPERGTEVVVVDYNSVVEVVFQGTNLVEGIDHPMHLHGYRFYVVGYGFGNFDKDKDPAAYNLIDPPFQNTVIVPRNGWATIRFEATNPGVWFLHCHLERHLTWGMKTVFIVRNGMRRHAKLLPPPLYMPPC